MKATLSRVGLSDLLCGSSWLRRAERDFFLVRRVRADAECEVFTSWVDSTLTNIQSTSRLIHTISAAFNGGAAGNFVDSTRGGDITPGITRRAHNVSGTASCA